MAPPFNFKTSGFLKNDPLLIALPDKGAVGAKWKVERVKLKVGVSWRFAQTVLRNATHGTASCLQQQVPGCWKLECSYFIQPSSFKFRPSYSSLKYHPMKIW